MTAIRRWPWRAIVGIKWVPPKDPNCKDLDVPPRTLCYTYDEFGALLQSLLDSARGVSAAESAGDGSSTSESPTRVDSSDISTVADFYLTTFCDFDHWADNILEDLEKETSTDGIAVRDIAKQGLAAFKSNKLIPISALVDFLLPFAYDPKRFLDRVQSIIVDGRESREAFKKAE